MARVWATVLLVGVACGVVVVGAILVHVNGVDFTLLEPLWLTIGSFVLLPVVFCAALHLIAENALVGGGIMFKPLLVLGLVLAVVAFPLTLMLGIGYWGTRGFRAAGGLPMRMWAWALRAALALVFVLAVADLVSDARTLSGLLSDRGLAAVPHRECAHVTARVDVVRPRCAADAPRGPELTSRARS